MKLPGHFIFIAAIVLAGCDNADDGFQKSANGLSYKIISDGRGDPLMPGQFLKIQVKQMYGDSVLSDTRKTMPQFQHYDSNAMSAQAWNIFSNARSGDSIIFKVKYDSAFARAHPELVRKNKELITSVKVLKILPDSQSVRMDYELEKESRKRN